VGAPEGEKGQAVKGLAGSVRPSITLRACCKERKRRICILDRSISLLLLKKSAGKG